MVNQSNSTGSATLTITRDGAMVREFVSTDIQADFQSFIAHGIKRGASQFAVVYKKSVEKDGDYDFKYDRPDGTLTYLHNGKTYDVSGAVKVTTSKNGDKQELAIDGTYEDASRTFTIKGTAYVEFKFS